MNRSSSVVLLASDGSRYEIDAVDARRSGQLRAVLDAFADGDEVEGAPPVPVIVPVPNVDGETLALILEFCSGCRDRRFDGRTWLVGRVLSAAAASANADDDDDDAQQQKGRRRSLFAVMNAADYMDVEPLLDLTIEAAAHMTLEALKRDGLPGVRETLGVDDNLSGGEKDEAARKADRMRQHVSLLFM